MGHEVWFDDSSGVAHIATRGALTPANIREMFEALDALLANAPRRLVLVELGDSPPPNKEVRDVLTHEAPPFDKFAFVGATAPVRMIGKMIMALFGKTDKTRFVATEQEALAWLTQE